MTVEIERYVPKAKPEPIKSITVHTDGGSGKSVTFAWRSKGSNVLGITSTAHAHMNDVGIRREHVRELADALYEMIGDKRNG